MGRLPRYKENSLSQAEQHMYLENLGYSWHPACLIVHYTRELRWGIHLPIDKKSLDTTRKMLYRDPADKFMNPDFNYDVLAEELEKE